MKGEGLYHYYNNPGTITTSYRKGAWEVYCTMNKHLHEFFDKVDDYDFGRQLKIHLIYYACNCIGMAMRLPRSQAISDIKVILNDKNLKESFRGLSFTKVPIRLKMMLYIMKLRMPRLLYLLRK
jgi:hypothetical protein